MCKVHLLKKVSLEKWTPLRIFCAALACPPLIPSFSSISAFNNASFASKTPTHLSPFTHRTTSRTSFASPAWTKWSPTEPNVVLFAVNLSFLPELPLYVCVLFVILPAPLFIVLTPNV